ncbi:hypothetical protein ACFPM0_05095 [Pseudonocardia sulfidoxydans]
MTGAIRGPAYPAEFDVRLVRTMIEAAWCRARRGAGARLSP